MPGDALRGDVTRLLNEIRDGNGTAESELFAIIYGELHRMAVRFMRSERPGHTLQPTALVHEAYLRILGESAPEWQNRAHFLAVGAQAMRRILLDHARKRSAAKRGGDPLRVELAESLVPGGEPGDDIIALEEALLRLEKWDPRLGRIVELRFFAGLTDEEAALVLGVSTRTVQRDWSTAKAWLYSEMTKR